MEEVLGVEGVVCEHVEASLEVCLAADTSEDKQIGHAGELDECIAPFPGVDGASDETTVRSVVDIVVSSSIVVDHIPDLTGQTKQ